MNLQPGTLRATVLALSLASIGMSAQAQEVIKVGVLAHIRGLPPVMAV